MIAAELHRLSALYGTGLLDPALADTEPADAAPQQAIDALVALAATLLDCPVAMLNLIDHDVQHVRASVGTTVTNTPRGVALCDHTIRQSGVMVVPDLAADPRFATNPLIGEGIRFYAGAPVSARDANGTPRPIGALCVTDATPRRLDDRNVAALAQLADLADLLIAAYRDARRAITIAVEHQRLGTELARQHRVFAQAERLSGIGAWRLMLADDRIEWSEGVYRIYGLPPGSPPSLQAALDPYPTEARGRVAAALARAVEECAEFDFEEDFHPVGGGVRRVRCVGECERAGDEKVAVVGVFQDVTERYVTEAELRRSADTDALTGLSNRSAFDRHLAAAIDRARDAAATLLLVLIDLDGFKAVNDTLGHAAGDDVLRAIGRALGALPFATTLTARIGGDEFALLIEDAAIPPDVITATLEAALMVGASAGGLTLTCGGSVGMAMLGDETSPRDFVHRADQALYIAKRARVGDRRRRAA